ncbi:hypothetical protein [Aquimarina aquimarini]|uniref:hypothetical protein n=1 Tax=Aquimarina aquimarini TaxID=1191734 RepID=UPI000D5553F3|nr:hypothetical protein [Aquimarina aquimarini]
MKQLNRFLDTKKGIYFEALKELTIENEQTLVTHREEENVYGIYDIFKGALYAIISLKNRNFLFLKDEFVEVTESVHIEYHVSQSKKEPNYFEVFHEDKSLIKVTYMHKKKRTLLPSHKTDNQKEANFGYMLAMLVNKVKENPKLILFPDTAYADL